MNDHVIGLIFFGAIAVGVYVYYRWTKHKERKQFLTTVHARPTLTGRKYGGIIEDILDGKAFLRIDVEEGGGYAYVHMPDRGLRVGDHVTIEEYSDGTWDAVTAREARA